MDSLSAGDSDTPRFGANRKEKPRPVNHDFFS
jgi:hypothetical protein